MPQSLRLSLSRVKYQGDSIGRDIRVEIEVNGKRFKTDRRIKAGETKEINEEIHRIATDQKAVESDISITVTEKDLLFNDTGKIRAVLKIDSSQPFPQKFEYTVPVMERKKVFWKKKAVFTIIIQAELGDNYFDKLKRYQSYSGEDYNRYDLIISEIVRYWNREFLKDTDPPPEPLDPNLVKAITYQESRVGNDPRNNGLINIMQVGNPGDPSVKTLRGDLPEYWIHNGKQILLEYEAKVESVRDSVYWGVRWLYHKAQYIGLDRRRRWNDWKKTVHEYGPNKKQYTESVWDIYTKGIKKEGGNTIKLWILLILLIFVVPTFIFYDNVKAAYIKQEVLRAYHTEARPADNVAVRFYESQPELFLAILESTKDWSEGLYVGRMKRGRIEWLDIKDPPIEQSILSARFIELAGVSDPVLEVYGETHMGNGNIYLYRVRQNELALLFDAVAVDNYNNNIWRPGGYPEYGYSTCGEVYQSGKLAAEYRDLNNDGVSDVILSGAKEVICEDRRGHEPYAYQEVKADEIPVRLTYFLKS